MHAIRIDRSKTLPEQPEHGHNRYHPDIEPILEVGEAEEVLMETRDGMDGQLQPGATDADVANIDAGLIHPLTGPLYISSTGVFTTAHVVPALLQLRREHPALVPHVSQLAAADLAAPLLRGEIDVAFLSHNRHGIIL